MTRLPPPLRLDASRALGLIEARLPSWVTLDPEAHADAVRRLAAENVAAGAAYDGLIAITAAHHGAELLTLTRRAARTYRGLAVGFSLLAGR